jgi:Ca-activated chloride channel family protein
VRALITFESPLRLLVLLVVPALLVLAVLVARRRGRYPVAYTNLAVLAAVAPERRGSWRRLVPLALLLLALVFAAGAIAHPRVKLSEPDQNATIVLLVDVSGSMRADDVMPSRLGAAVDAMTTFLNQLPPQFKVGLVAFSSTPQPMVAPTLDRSAIRQSIGLLQPEAGTAVGDGVAVAVHMLTSSLHADGYVRKPGQPVPGAIVLLSDGAQNQGVLQPQQAAELAKAAGVRIYPVSLGTPNGTVTYGIGPFANQIPVPPDPVTMSEIAQISGGRAFTAQTAGSVVQIYRTLGSSIGRMSKRVEVASWFAAIAAGLLAAAVGAGALLGSRMP